MKLTHRQYIALGAVSVIVVALIGGRWYLGSEAFARMLEQELSKDGVSVGFDEPLRWSSVFPQVTVDIPAVMLALSDGAYRLRIRDIEFSAPLSVLLSRDIASEDPIELTISNAAMIADHHPGESGDSKNAWSETDLRSLLERLMHLRGEFRIENGEVVRRRDGMSQRVKVGNLHVTLDELSANVTGTVAVDDALPTLFSSEFDYRAAENDVLPVDVNMTLAPGSRGEEQKVDVRVSGTLGVGRDTIFLRDMSVASGSNQASAEFAFTPKSRRLHGEMSLKRAEIGDFTDQKKQHRKLFPDTSINYQWLGDADVNVAIGLGAVRLNGVPLIGGNMSFTVSDGKALLEGKDLRILGGDGSLEWRAKGLDEKPQFNVQASADEIDVSRIGTLLGGTEIFLEGSGALRSTMSYSGDSPAAHVKSASGTLTLGAAESILAPGVLSWIDQSLVSYGRLAASKGQQEPKELRMPCARAHFALDQGFLGASKSIVAETPDNIIVSSGYADLDTERLSFTFAARTKKTIDWSLLSQVKYVQLGGTLREPKLTINQSEAVKKGALLATSYFLGPIPSLAYSAIETAGKHGEAKPTCTPIQ